ncbi:MAG: hypothetical protein HQK75_02375 [Candidatus Magnetomorum sp.]|nr:hypothetical protein [Candidatus Magnetomorum sp.]
MIQNFWRMMVILFFAVHPCPLYSDVIDIQSQLTVNQSADQLTLALELSNKGSIRAIDVSVAIQFLETMQQSKIIDCFTSGQTKTIRMNVAVPEDKKGAFPLICEIQFHDDNLFPFFSLYCTNIYLRTRKFSETLTATIKDIYISDQQTVSVLVQNNESKDQNIIARIILPGALTCKNDSRNIVLMNAPLETVLFQIFKKDALPASHHRGYVLMNYIKNSIHHSIITPFSIHVDSNEMNGHLTKKYLLWGFTGLTLIWILIISIYSRVNARRP